MTDFNLADLDAQDEVQLAIKHPKSGQPTTWVWTFFGPGHPTTVTLADQASRAAIRRRAEQNDAVANGKKWSAPEETPDGNRRENIDNIVARLKGFTPVNLGDGVVEYSPEKAREFLLDRRKGWLLGQVMLFLAREENFIQPSATS